jgi:hypothetical protein
MYKITTRVSSVGAMSEEDMKTFIEWAWKARAINCFDPDVIGYPRSIMLAADDNEGPLLYLPVQPVLMLESLAPRPDVSPRKEAMALWKMGEMLEGISKDTGIQEQYFMCKDDRVADICSKHGFEEMKGYRLMKKKIKPLELPPELEEEDLARQG